MATFFDRPMSFLLRMDHGNVKKHDSVDVAIYNLDSFFCRSLKAAALLSNRPSHVLLCKIPTFKRMVITSTTGDFLERIYSTQNWVNHSHLCINLFAWNLPWNGSFQFGCMFETFLIKRIRNARKPKFRNWSLWSSSRLISASVIRGPYFRMMSRKRYGKKELPDTSSCKKGFRVCQFLVTFSGWLSDPFQWLSDLQLGDEKVTLNHLGVCLFFNTSWFNNIEISQTDSFRQTFGWVVGNLWDPNFQKTQTKMKEKWSKTWLY